MLSAGLLEPPDVAGPTQKAQRRALTALTLAFVFQPILHPAGPANSSPVDLFLIASIVCFVIWVRKEPRKLQAPYFFPFALIVIAGAASGIAGQFPSTAFQAILVDLLLFAWCTTIANVVNSPRALQHILSVWAISGIVWSMIVVFAWLGHVTPIEGLNAADGNRVLFTFGDPNYASTYWLTTLFVIYAIQRPATRWLRIVGYVSVFWALALTESNGGFLSLAIGLCFLTLVKIFRKRGWAGVVAAVISLGLVVGTFLTLFPLNTIRQKALYSNQPLLVNSIGRSAQSSSERSLLITEMGHLYNQTDGILGIGPGATKPTLTAQLAVYPNEAHDDWLAALVEEGPIGFVGLLLLVGSAALWCGPLVRRRVSSRFAAVIPFPLGLAVGLFALSVNSFYEEIFHFRFLWALLAIVAVVGKDSRLGRRNGISQQPT